MKMRRKKNVQEKKKEKRGRRATRGMILFSDVNCDLGGIPRIISVALTCSFTTGAKRGIGGIKNSSSSRSHIHSLLGCRVRLCSSEEETAGDRDRETGLAGLERADIIPHTEKAPTKPLSVVRRQAEQKRLKKTLDWICG